MHFVWSYIYQELYNIIGFFMWTERFLVKTAFLSRQIICFSLDLLSANILCNVAREKKLPKMLLTDMRTQKTHKHVTKTTAGKEEKEWEDVMGRSFPSFSIFLLTWGHPTIGLNNWCEHKFQWWYHPIVHDRQTINVKYKYVIELKVCFILTAYLY